MAIGGVIITKVFMRKKVFLYRIIALALFITISVGLYSPIIEIISFLRAGTISEDFGGSLSNVLMITLFLIAFLYVPYNFWSYQYITIDNNGFSPPVRRSFTYVVKRKNPHITWKKISKVEIYKKNATKSGEMLAHTYRVYLKDEKFSEGVNNTFKSSKNPKKIFFEIPKKYKDSSEALEEALKKKIPEKIEYTS